ncbi:hypothetical protein [Cohaesibacter marisflavi]|uniref:hypothetical protein n=1 Tax=Cohaesibacter marisflavi TaxID=655353 RepID=UPI0029C8E3B4|nr:hypothetical protein [Cohaesibacter marisflavi]
MKKTVLFTQASIKRAIKGAKDAGTVVTAMQITARGEIKFTLKDSDSTDTAPPDEWDEIL